MKNIFYLLILILIFSGCEKVIDVDLNESDPAIVIEGNLNYNPYLNEVKISMTSSYFDTLPTEKVSGAIVSVSSDFGGEYIFDETENGIYRSNEIRLKLGETYHLSVEANGEKYEASSRLNPPVNIDSVKFFYQDGFSFIESGYYVNLYLFDPPGISNYYRVKVTKNGVLQNTIDDFFIFDDRYVDGNSIEINLFNSAFNLNDTVSVQLISLDEGAYEYLETFQEVVNNNPGSAAPANPNSNLSNGALGYFSAWSSDTKTFIIQEK
ncbi:MAG TPA: DUF4249 domain-containing protein [Draconibacterium sp.]|nr:DUF4249 domain-containing protein [Draconibacterium sp.]